MATDGTIVPPLYNRESDALVQGELVRISGTNGIVRAQADSSGHVLGYEGVVESGKVNASGPVVVRSVGRKRVLLVAGLTPTAGDLVYVSAATAGRGTNVAPGIPVPVGTIADASKYTTDNSCIVILPAIGAASGTQGAQGASGAQGAQGSTGGAQGAQGASGSQGAQGAAGSGAQGAQGSGGAQGASGAQGSAGAQGGAGSQGAQGAAGTTLAAIYTFGLSDNPTVDNNLVGSYFSTYFDTDGSIFVKSIANASGQSDSHPGLRIQRDVEFSGGGVQSWLTEQHITQLHGGGSPFSPEIGARILYTILNSGGNVQDYEFDEHYRIFPSLGPPWVPGSPSTGQVTVTKYNIVNRTGSFTPHYFNSDGVYQRPLIFPDNVARTMIANAMALYADGGGTFPADGSRVRWLVEGGVQVPDPGTNLVAFDAVQDTQIYGGGQAKGHWDFLTSTLADGMLSSFTIGPGLMTVKQFGTTQVAALAFEDGALSPVSLANTAAFRYDLGTDKIQYSKNTGAWTDLV